MSPRYRFLFALACTFALALPVQAQHAADRPASFEAAEAQALGSVPVLTMPAVNNDALVARDAARADGKAAPLRFAEPFEVEASTRGTGTWETLADGTRLWRLRIASAGAYSLNLGFSRFRLPGGAALWLYPAGEAPHIRAFTAADNEAHGELWSPIIRGDEIVVELNLPRTKSYAADDFELEIARVNHAYRPVGISRATWDETDFARSGSCNVDVVCPEGDGFRDIIRSVGAYSVGGIDFCSGSAMNNTAMDGRPLFLTADHCGVRASNAASTVIYWNYENSTCRTPGSPASGGPGDGPRDQFSSGVMFMDTSGGGTSGGPDWTIVETDDPIPPEYSVYLNGWDRRDQATASAIAIHHPGVEEKRISFENQPTSIDSYLGSSGNPAGTHLKVDDWDLGTTEGGSSGSPLFSPEKRVVGQLSGGFASCTSQTADWYGRMARNMTTGAEAFLDPGNTGALFIDGMEAGNPPGPIQLAASMTADPVSVAPGETTTITVQLRNAGTETGETVMFENVLPEGLAYAGNLSASLGEAGEEGGTVTWTVDVADGGSETLSFDVTVDENAPGGALENEAQVEHPSLAFTLRPSVTLNIFIAPDFFYTNDTGLAISDDGCPNFQTSSIDVADSFALGSLKVGAVIEHTYRGDLRLLLESPEGTVVSLLDRAGTGSFGSDAPNLDALFSDTGAAGIFGSGGSHDPGAPFFEIEGQTEQGEPGTNGVDPLSDFAGEDPQGTWTLSVCDGAGQDTGALDQWALFFFTDNPTDLEDEATLAGAYRLDAAYPNPFSGSAEVRFAVREAQTVRAEVLDLLGRRVQTLLDAPVPAGVTHTLRLDGTALAGGTYVVRLTGESFTASRKVVVVK
ncbi:MAG: proprotein convertase P-domain-containing protein [Bacteroidota bacterium]